MGSLKAEKFPSYDLSTRDEAAGVASPHAFSARCCFVRITSCGELVCDIMRVLHTSVAVLDVVGWWGRAEKEVRSTEIGRHLAE